MWLDRVDSEKEADTRLAKFDPIFRKVALVFLWSRGGWLCKEPSEVFQVRAVLATNR